MRVSSSEILRLSVSACASACFSSAGSLVRCSCSTSEVEVSPLLRELGGERAELTPTVAGP